MLKKIVSYFLVSAMMLMMLSLMSLGVFAEAGTTENTVKTGVYDVSSYTVIETKKIRDITYDVIEIDDAKYVVIGTKAEFLNLRHKIDGLDDLILNDGYNYILKNDIDFDDTVFGHFHGLSLRNGAVFEGNGFSLTGFSFNAGKYGIGLFIAANDDSQFEVKNLTLGGANGEEIVCTPTGNGGGLIIGEAVAAAALTLENVTIYVNTEVTALHYLSAFIGTNNGTVVMNDCKAYGTIKTTGGSVGGFVGRNKGTVTLTNCINSVQISADQTVGALVGNGTATVTSCYSTVNDYTFTPYAGGDKGTYNMNGAAYITDLEGTPISSEGEFARLNGDGGLYRLANDLTLTKAVEISGGTDGAGVILDLNGKTLTGNLIVTGGTLLIKNGTLSSNTDTATIACKGNSVCTFGSIIVSGKVGVSLTESAFVQLGANVTVTATEYAVLSEGATADAMLEINGASLTVDGDASSDSVLKWNSLATVNIINGTLRAEGQGNAFEFINGKAVITDGTFVGNYALVLAGVENSTLNIETGSFKGSAAAIRDQNNSASIMISGGTFEGTANGAFATDAVSTTIEIMDGIFDEEVPAAYILQYYVCIQNENGTYTVDLHEHTYENCEYEYINTVSHRKFCTICNEKVSDVHQWSDYTDNGEGQHYRFCIGCKVKQSAQAHEEEIDAATGNTVCKTCGAIIATQETTTTANPNATQETTTTANPNEQVNEGGCKSTVSYTILAVLFPMICALFLARRKDSMNEEH